MERKSIIEVNSSAGDLDMVDFHRPRRVSKINMYYIEMKRLTLDENRWIIIKVEYANVRVKNTRVKNIKEVHSVEN